jgi:hypothetical protein
MISPFTMRNRDLSYWIVTFVWVAFVVLENTSWLMHWYRSTYTGLGPRSLGFIWLAEDVGMVMALSIFYWYWWCWRFKTEVNSVKYVPYLVVPATIAILIGCYVSAVASRAVEPTTRDLRSVVFASGAFLLIFVCSVVAFPFTPPELRRSKETSGATFVLRTIAGGATALFIAYELVQIVPTLSSGSTADKICVVQSAVRNSIVAVHILLLLTVLVAAVSFTAYRRAEVHSPRS